MSQTALITRNDTVLSPAERRIRRIRRLDRLMVVANVAAVTMAVILTTMATVMVEYYHQLLPLAKTGTYVYPTDLVNQQMHVVMYIGAIGLTACVVAFILWICFVASTAPDKHVGWLLLPITTLTVLTFTYVILNSIINRELLYGPPSF